MRRTSTCTICGQPAARGAALCAPCRAALKRAGQRTVQELPHYRHPVPRARARRREPVASTADGAATAPRASRRRSGDTGRRVVLATAAVAALAGVAYLGQAQWRPGDDDDCPGRRARSRRRRSPRRRHCRRRPRRRSPRRPSLRRRPCVRRPGRERRRTRAAGVPARRDAFAYHPRRRPRRPRIRPSMRSGRSPKRRVSRRRRRRWRPPVRRRRPTAGSGCATRSRSANAKAGSRASCATSARGSTRAKATGDASPSARTCRRTRADACRGAGGSPRAIA